MSRVIHDQFDAMGSTVEVVIVGDDIELVDEARSVVQHLEQCWSRFLPHSDVTRINLAEGAPVTVHADTIALVEAMREGMVATDGAFDPTMLAALVDHGYGASRKGEPRSTMLPRNPRRRVAADLLEFDRLAAVVHVPAGTCLDPGGIGKGLAADLTVERLLGRGAVGALVSVGGDVRVAGEAPQEGGWRVDVLHADHEWVTAQLRLADGGVATSGTARRRWHDDEGVSRHHLLDPQTLRSRPDTGELAVAEVTVVAVTSAWAEVWTKYVLVNGAPEGLARLDALRLPARAVLSSGVAVVNQSWGAVALTPTTLGGLR